MSKNEQILRVISNPGHLTVKLKSNARVSEQTKANQRQVVGSCSGRKDEVVSLRANNGALAGWLARRVLKVILHRCDVGISARGSIKVYPCTVGRCTFLVLHSLTSLTLIKSPVILYTIPSIPVLPERCLIVMTFSSLMTLRKIINRLFIYSFKDSLNRLLFSQSTVSRPTDV